VAINLLKTLITIVKRRVNGCKKREKPPFGMYRYNKIIFNYDTKIFITCLMINDIENTLEDLLRLKAEKHFRLLNLLH
jgi:hypothetical protein